MRNGAEPGIMICKERQEGQKNMFSFFRKRPDGQKTTYSHEEMTPAIRCSICTGEQTAGFRRRADGSFQEVMLIRNEDDLRQFREQYGITGEIEKIY